ncbi:VOC family protein [Sulfitobacter sp. G21635-S1]|uniref:VOC family protein n=1 Tax=Sulfitobacter sp. G21635-S1 TaxID=3014043 RepID=UPI002F35FAF0
MFHTLKTFGRTLSRHSGKIFFPKPGADGGLEGAARRDRIAARPERPPCRQTLQEALVADGIPAASFQVDDLVAEFGKLTANGVSFTRDPLDAGPVRMAVFNDSCGNLIQLVQTAGGQK